MKTPILLLLGGGSAAIASIATIAVRRKRAAAAASQLAIAPPAEPGTILASNVPARTTAAPSRPAAPSSRSSTPAPMPPLAPPRSTSQVPPEPIISTPADRANQAELIHRLRTDEGYRENFALQALFYSWGFTESVPDALMGPATRTNIRKINELYGDPAPASDQFQQRTMNRVIDVLIRTTHLPGPYRLLPFTLPRDVVDAVNSSMNRLTPGGPALQVRVAA